MIMLLVVYIAISEMVVLLLMLMMIGHQPIIVGIAEAGGVNSCASTMDLGVL